MRFTFLGTAAGERYPSVWCACDNCVEARALGGRSLRKCSAALIDDRLLIDLGPDLTASALAHGLDLSGVRYGLLTHDHPDHLDPHNLAARNPWGTDIVPHTLDWYAGPRSIVTAARRTLGLGRESFLEGELERFRLRVHPVLPGKRFDVGPYRVTSVRASHGGPEQDFMLFVVGDGHKTVFYAADTGPLSPEAWATLREDGRRLDLVVMDATMGFGHLEPHHLNAIGALEQVARLREEGLLAPGARVFAHHFSHYFNPTHEKLREFYAPHGVEVPYDGLAIEL